jgi:regulatory protein
MEESEKKKQAWLTSLRLLAASPKTRHELAQKLTQKGYPSPIIGEVMRKLEEQGILNDQAYALNLMNRFKHGRPSGRKRIAFELKRHGVAPSVQEEILKRIDPQEEKETARQLGQERWERLSQLSQDKRKRRVYDFLIRRGFDFQAVRDLVEEFARASD